MEPWLSGLTIWRVHSLTAYKTSQNAMPQRKPKETFYNLGNFYTDLAWHLWHCYVKEIRIQQSTWYTINQQPGEKKLQDISMVL